MCGIFGWMSKAPPPEIDAWMSRAGTLLEHRGPDGVAIWRGSLSDGMQVAFGHRLLSIIGVGQGAQPFWSEDKCFVVTYNGEIYNYIELRQELQTQGCTFRTGCDTEVLIEAYRVWGLNV